MGVEKRPGASQQSPASTPVGTLDTRSSENGAIGGREAWCLAWGLGVSALSQKSVCALPVMTDRSLYGGLRISHRIERSFSFDVIVKIII